MKESDINYNLNLGLLITGRGVSSLGTSILNFALSLYVLDLTGSAAAFSLVLSMGILPAVFVNIFGAVFVDKYDKKKIIVISDILSGISVLVYAYIFSLNSESLLILILYVSTLSVLQSFFNLAINASIPNIVSNDRVTKANSVLQAEFALLRIIGPILGAIAYNSIGMELIFLINGISFIISGISEIFIMFTSKVDKKQDKSIKYIDNVKEVFKYLNTQKVIKFLLTFGVIINFIYNPLILMVIAYINYNVINVSSFQLSLIEASIAVGVIVGAVFVSLYKSPNVLISKFFKLLLIQSILILFWIFPETPIFDNSSKWLITIVFCIILLSISALNTIQNIPLFSYFHLKIPEELRGRVFGILNTALMISTPIGMWLYGLFFEFVDWIYIPIISGILMIILVLIGSRNKYFKGFIETLRIEEKQSMEQDNLVQQLVLTKE